jgi:alkanesulfonate monooxygenase SsuD/methylene tetrahydromethanopterin reductase-like flavin-dependent oxidoreductase (luciferase family)
MAMAMLRRGRLISVPPVETALRFLASDEAAARPGRRTVVGTPERVRTGLEEVASEYGAEEVIVVTITHSHAARKRSYELIAEAFGVAPATAGRQKQGSKGR